MSYKPLENVTIVFSTANITVCADEWGDLYYTTEIPDEFVVGYGLDYAQKYRNLPYIGVVEFHEDEE
mgnify:CR=1 FL=1